MSFFNDYFGGHVICINCAHRPDRKAHAEKEFERLGISPVIWFDGHTEVVVDGRVSGNAGCTASHRGVLEIIAHNRWERTMVFEDDFEVIYSDFHERFERFIAQLPADWNLFYLGGGYAEKPIRRVSPRVFQVAGMMTTSSYAITWQQARRMAPYVSGVGPIDSIFQGFNLNAPTYVMSPRAIVQYPNHSDLQEREMSNAASMMDKAMEPNL